MWSKKNRAGKYTGARLLGIITVIEATYFYNVMDSQLDHMHYVVYYIIQLSEFEILA